MQKSFYVFTSVVHRVLADQSTRSRVIGHGPRYFWQIRSVCNRNINIYTREVLLLLAGWLFGWQEHHQHWFQGQQKHQWQWQRLASALAAHLAAVAT